MESEKQTDVSPHKCTVMGVCLCLLMPHTHTLSQSTSISPIHSVSISLCVSGSVLLFQSGPCCNTISLSAFKTMARALSLLFILCVYFYYNTLEIKLCSLFPFPLWGLTFKCIHADQSPKPDNTNISFLAICREITCGAILEKEN